MRRFIVMHKTEAGFDSSEAAQKWIDTVKSSERRAWRVVEITVDPITELTANQEHACELEREYVRGVEMARKLLRLQLGLGTPLDN